MAAEMTREAHLQCTTACCLGGVLCVSVALERGLQWLGQSGRARGLHVVPLHPSSYELYTHHI